MFLLSSFGIGFPPLPPQVELRVTLPKQSEALKVLRHRDLAQAHASVLHRQPVQAKRYEDQRASTKSATAR